MRALARRAKVSHNAPYRHFPDREALLAALAAEGFARLGNALAEAGQQGPRARGAAYVRFALEQPQRFRLMFGGVLRISAHPGLREQASRAYEGLVSAFAALGEPRAAQVTAAAAWSLVHGLAQLLLDGHFKRAAREGQGTEAFVQEVLGAVRFTLAAQRPSA